MIQPIKNKIISSILLLIGIWSFLPAKQAFSYTLTNNRTGQTSLSSNQETLIASPYNLMSPYPYPLGNGGNSVYIYNRYPSSNIDNPWGRTTSPDYYNLRRRVDYSEPYSSPYSSPRSRKDHFNCTSITQGVSNSSGFTTIRHEFCH